MEQTFLYPILGLFATAHAQKFFAMAELVPQCISFGSCLRKERAIAPQTLIFFILILITNAITLG
jgi:hypothetical protein